MIKISELNNANIVTIDSELFCITINKINHTIIQTKQLEKDFYRNATIDCEKMEKDYTIGDIVVGTPYSFGMVCSKILNNRADKKCVNFIKLCHVMMQ